MKIEILVSVDGEDTIYVDEVPDVLAPMVKKIMEMVECTPAEMAAMGIRGAVIDALADALGGKVEQPTGGPLCDCPVCEAELKEFFERNEDRLPTA